jgi:hypothetical protein
MNMKCFEMYFILWKKMVQMLFLFELFYFKITGGFLLHPVFPLTAYHWCSSTYIQVDTLNKRKSQSITSSINNIQLTV